MSTMAQNQGLQGKIRRLIQSQHDHEKQWWAGREALLKKQGARAEKKQQLDEVLRSVGAPIDNKVITTPEEDRAEVARYDAKVYKASVQMAEALHTELRALQMPFFAINRHLVVSEASKDDGNKLLNADTQGTVTQDELSALQRRILELLQDICKE
ncbi:hypothetical protein ASPZODRAFT_75369 [Penicilliopsis zonata CBS 506.65]|uniref:Uncharacterized protein n=1 Tax=Penicilliopsis zonata CBS 506.65 TaxID=1073090 RepID=A0A1L9S741_9EURO|nr:hypothetical protein ASPZODRAFT_75369 [Penicilliopsis zonata CBS 506.65]OJJ42976.1 hypothetical protein ASPZODRAFT_75369 [Penicilliopsis zonata CBS 506.65]